MKSNVESASSAYDGIVGEYDRVWSVHVREPQQRLTRELRLSSGLRCADLGCGTGLDTLEMLRVVAPGEVVAVDCSARMLEVARERAQAAGHALTTRCQDFADFITGEPPRSYDVVTLRFSLGYLDWRTLLPTLPTLLAPGGRVGLLSIMATSAHQAYEAYGQIASELGMQPQPRTGPETLADVENGLRAGGARIDSSWLSSFRLSFASGEDVAQFLQETGIATHPLLETLPADFRRALWARFARAVEAFRTPAGVPLDFQLAGVTASPAEG